MRGNQGPHYLLGSPASYRIPPAAHNVGAGLDAPADIGNVAKCQITPLRISEITIKSARLLLLNNWSALPYYLTVRVSNRQISERVGLGGDTFIVVYQSPGNDVRLVQLGCEKANIHIEFRYK